MNVTLTGATGFLGSRIVASLLAAGHKIHIIGRRPPASLPPGVSFSLWQPASDEPPLDALRGAAAVVHLAGEPVAQRWTAAVKDRIRSSRIDRTLQLATALASIPNPPPIFLSASAIGYYGSRGDEILTEASPPGHGFLADVCVEWERAAAFVETLGARTVILRIGIVLGPGGGALAKMLPPFRAGLGGRIGPGSQWMSWIHIDDIAALVSFALTNNSLHGPLNLTAPNPATNSDFTSALAKTLHRPAPFPVPALALRALFGDMSSMLLASQRVLPQTALDAGFRFSHPTLAPALASLDL